MGKLALILLLLLSNNALSKQIKIAVIDTGINPSLVQRKFLCKDGHKDFSGTSIADSHGHGSSISGLIDQAVKNKFFNENLMNYYNIDKVKADYCQVIVKYYNLKSPSTEVEVSAWEYAISLKPDLINFSSGGTEFSYQEEAVVKKALDSGIIVVVAAGNDGRELGKKYMYYPAVLDKRLIVVGAVDSNNKKTETSNYSNKYVDFLELGSEVISYGLLSGNLSTAGGTSQAAAIRSGKIIRQILLKNKGIQELN